MIVETSTFKININSYNKLYKLFEEYCRRKNGSATEFIEAKLCSESPPLTDVEADKLVLIVKHKKFLHGVAKNFISHYKLRNYNHVKLMAIIFVILFASEHVNANELFEVFKQIKCAFRSKLLQYFWDDNNLIETALTGCKLFEDKYVLDNIINPVLNKKELLKEVDDLLFKEAIRKRMPKPPTIPDLVLASQKKKTIPMVPMNTPAEIKPFRATQIPRTLYIPDSTEKKLVGEFEKNRLKAQKLLIESKALDKNFCKPKKPVTPKEPPKIKFKAKKAPKFQKDVETRDNIATVLREGSRCVKEKEAGIKEIEEIIRGGAVMDKYRELEEEEKREQKQKSIEEIERKHLEGLLTFEEAILAKQKLLENNKERFKEFIKEREEFLDKLQQWKDEEQKRIQVKVKKCQAIERNAKDMSIKVKEEKKIQANQLRDENKKILQEACEKQKEELARKVKLIEEIKCLHQLRTLQATKEFDPTECPNLGFLCEMSISDLQKKLSEVKLQMKQQLEQKRKCIQEYKEKRKNMVENVKNFITQARMSKSKQELAPIRSPTLARSPELDKLRNQLDRIKEKRKNI